MEGYTGSVTIVTAGAPAGVSAVASNVGTTGTTTTGTITVSVAAGVVAGSYPLTVTGSGAGVSSVQTTLTLTVTAAPLAADFSLSATSPLALAPGASGTVPVTITRTNFTEAVVLTVTGLPTGVTAAFAPAAPTGTTSTLTLQVGASVAPGSYPLQIVGTGAPGSRTSALSLTVSVAGSYALTVKVTVTPTGSVSTTVTVTPTGGFTGAVALGIAGLPAGVSASFSPTSTSTTSTLTLTTAGAAPGTSTLTITGETVGLSDVNATLSATVMPVSASTTITLDYSACVAGDKVTWAAYRDGPSASWIPVTVSSNRFTFTLHNALGGVALASSQGVEVLLERTSWLADYAEHPCQPLDEERTVSGTATNLPANANGFMSFGTNAIEITSAQPAYSLIEVPLGVHDLLGYAYIGATVGVNNRAFIRRDVNPAPPGMMSAADFAGSESFAPQVASVSVVGVSAGQLLEHSMSYATRTGSATRCDIATFYEQLPVTGSTFSAYGVPASRQRADDVHVLNVRTSTTIGQTSYFQEAVESFHTFAGRTVMMPESFNPTASRVTSGSHHQLRVQGTLPAEYTTVLALSSGLSTDQNYGMLWGRVADELHGNADRG